MIISKKYEFIYIHFEKCGGTSVESSLNNVLGFNDLAFGSTSVGEAIDYNNFEKLGIRNVKNNYLWKHSTARQAYRYIGMKNWHKYKKVSVVRDPIDLGKSLFSFAEKVISYNIKNPDRYEWARMVRSQGFPDIWPYSEEYVRSYIRSSINQTKFDGFIQDLIDKDADCFSPFTERLKASFWHKDFGMVVDLSQLNERWEDICKHIEIPLQPLQHLNSSDSGSLVISSKTEDKIRRRFAADYDIIPQYTGKAWK